MRCDLGKSHLIESVKTTTTKKNNKKLVLYGHVDYDTVIIQYFAAYTACTNILFLFTVSQECLCSMCFMLDSQGKCSSTVCPDYPYNKGTTKCSDDNRKSQLTAFLLSLFLAQFGAANFYIGQNGLGEPTKPATYCSLYIHSYMQCYLEGYYTQVAQKRQNYCQCGDMKMLKSKLNQAPSLIPLCNSIYGLIYYTIIVLYLLASLGGLFMGVRTGGGGGGAEGLKLPGPAQRRGL